jgi:HAAS
MTDIPPDQHRQIIQEIRAHIDAKLEGRTDVSEAEVDAIITQLGDPADIAQAARMASGAQPPRVGTRDRVTIALLLVGGFILPLLGWLLGALLLWTSQTWRLRDRLIGTVLTLGGLLVPVMLLFAPTSPSSCSGGGGPSQPTVEHCSGGATGISTAVFIALAVLAVAVAIYGAFRLARAARRVAAGDAGLS